MVNLNNYETLGSYMRCRKPSLEILCEQFEQRFRQPETHTNRSCGVSVLTFPSTGILPIRKTVDNAPLGVVSVFVPKLFDSARDISSRQRLVER